MLFWKNNDPPLKIENDFRTNTELFLRDYSHISNLVDCESSVAAKIAYLDFAITVIGRELETENTARFVRQGVADSQDGKEYFMPGELIETRRQVPLAPYNVISRPWDMTRLFRAAFSEFVYGHRRGERGVDGTLFEELGLVVISNGRHHQTVAKLKNRAFANELRVIRLADVFDRVTVDGGVWRIERDGEIRIEPCPDYRFALLFALAKKRYALQSGDGISERNHTAELTENEARTDTRRFSQLLREKNDELYALRMETELLRRHCARLLKKLEAIGVPDDILGQ